MRKKIFASILTLCMLLSLSLVATAQAAEYNDTKGHWAESQINRWSDYKVVQGTGDGFKPNDGMTRAAAAQVFSNLLGLSDTGDISKFTDLQANAWYTDAIRKAVAAGILTGTNDNKMLPDESVDRQQFFVMFARAMGLSEQSTTKGLAATGAASWAVGYINALTDRGYVKGGDNGVDPTGKIDRASVMALMDQTISAYCNTDNATLTAASTGITLVAAKNVTVSGTAQDMLVAAGASGGKTTARNLTVTGTLTIDAKSNLETSGKTTIAAVVLTAKAASVSVTVASGTTIDALTSNAENVTVSGAGKVTRANVNANNNKVNTNGTVVAVATGVTGTSAKNKAVAAGTTTTNSGSTSSGGGGGGGGGSSGGSGGDTPTPTSAYTVSRDASTGYILTIHEATTFDAAQYDKDNGNNGTYYKAGDDTAKFASVVIEAGVGDGNVTLKNVSANDVTVSGGGSNSIFWNAGRIVRNIFMRSTVSTPRLALSGGANLKSATIKAETPCNIADTDDTNPSTIGAVEVTATGENANIGIDAKVTGNVTVANGAGISVGGKTDIGTLKPEGALTIGTYGSTTGTPQIGTIEAKNNVTVAAPVAIKEVEVKESTTKVTVTLSNAAIKVEKVTANAAGGTEIAGDSAASVNTVDAKIGDVEAPAAIVAKVEISSGIVKVTVTGDANSTIEFEINTTETLNPDAITVSSEMQADKIAVTSETTGADVTIKTTDPSKTIETKTVKLTFATRLQNAVADQLAQITNFTTLVSTNNDGTTVLNVTAADAEMTVSKARNDFASLVVAGLKEAEQYGYQEATISKGTANATLPTNLSDDVALSELTTAASQFSVKGSDKLVDLGNFTVNFDNGTDKDTFEIVFVK